MCANGTLDEQVTALPHEEASASAHLPSAICHPSSDATIFQTPNYLMSYRRVFGAGKAFVRLRKGEASAFLQIRGRSARRLEWWGAGIHDLGGASGSAANIPALWRRINAQADDCDGASLAQIAAESPLVALAQRDGWTVSEAEACPVTVLPLTWEAYVASLGKNMREQIKRYPKRLEKEFRVEHELAQTPEQVTTALDDLFRLHGKRWRARGQTGVLATPRRQKFHRLLCEKLRAHDQLRLWTLRCDGQAVCVLLSYFYEGRYSFFIGGFEPEMQRWSVGTCGFARVLRHAIEEGATEFDFLRGEEEYKYRYGAQNRAYVTLSKFAPTPRGKLLRRRVLLEEAALRKLHEKFSAAHRKS